MADIETIAADIGLRLMGAFYALACPATIRAAAMSNFLDKALGAISPGDPRGRSAETWRRRFLVGNAYLFGAGGVLLMARLDLAAPVFVVSAASYAVYLAVLAPYLWDPFDPPEEPGRSRTRNAFWVYLGATAIVCAAWWQDALLPWRTQHWAVLFVCAVAVAAFGYFGLRQFRPWQSFPDLPATADDRPDDDGPARVVLAPGWYGSGMLDPDTGNHIYWLPEKYLPEDDSAQLSAWVDLFQELADPDDPYRAALKNPASAAQLEAEGRPIFDRLVGRMGVDRVGFEPQARPVAPQIATRAIKVMADYQCDPLWHAEDDQVGCFPAEHFGVSVSLANALYDWAMRFDGSCAADDPGKSLWTIAEEESHRQKGRELARRLADELARTGRGSMPVYYRPRGGPVEQVTGGTG